MRILFVKVLGVQLIGNKDMIHYMLNCESCPTQVSWIVKTECYVFPVCPVVFLSRGSSQRSHLTTIQYKQFGVSLISNLLVYRK